MATRGALLCTVDRPRRGSSILDRVYVNNPCYTSVRVLHSAVKSDHKAVVAYAGHVNVLPLNKRRQRRLFRRRSPAQLARFLEYASTLNIELDNDDVQLNFDAMLNLLDQFYSEREITVTSTSRHRANKLSQPTSLKSSLNGACSTFSITSGRLSQVWISYRPGSCGSVPHCSTSH